MSLLAANLDALAKYHPAAAASVAEVSETGEGEWSSARSGGVSVRRRGLALCSAFDPVVEAARAVPDCDGADFAFLPGLGAGYLAEAVTEQYPDLPVVVAESSPAWFREVLTHRDLSGLWSRVVPLIGSPDIVGDFFSSLTCPSVVTLTWRPLLEQEGEWQNAAADALARAQTRSGVNAATFRRFGPLWSRNLVRNEAQARPIRPLTALKGRWTGCRAVIAAAGPSLSDSLDWIAAHRDQMVLIGVDTVWTVLRRRGLEPDVLVALDGQYWNGRHLDRLPDTALVVTEWTGPPQAFRAGRVYVAATSLGLLRRRETERWGELGSLPTGGSVATAAWSLALHLGCTEVAFAGLDLGYPGGTHVRGSQFEETALLRAGRLGPAETAGLGLRGTALTKRPAVGGGQVPSDARMDLFRAWLSEAVTSRPDIRAVNLSLRGSLVDGLIPAPAGYGDTWPKAHAQSASDTVLSPRVSASVPPWDAIEDCLDPRLSDSEFARATDDLWTAARAYWGPAWDAWAGRTRAAWDRFPSHRTRRRLVELAALTLSWRRFWGVS